MVNPDVEARDGTHMPVAARTPLRFGYPDAVDETTARVVAAGIALLAGAFVVTGWGVLLVPLTYGFVVRVLAGPRLSPWARVAGSFVVPRLGLARRPVPGPPKRFAQGIGATLTVVASVAHLAGATTASAVFVAMVLGAASLEAVLGLCIGCRVFGALTRVGVIPERWCESCADITRRIDLDRTPGSPR
jgi:hypothetical protein